LRKESEVDKMGEINKAIEFLIEQLIETEKTSREIQKLSNERGISNRTLERAKARIGVKSRKNEEHRWSMRNPAESRLKALEMIEEIKRKQPLKEKVAKESLEYALSRDWVKITNVIEEAVEDKPSGAVKIKVGEYEIEAGGGFPVEKLASLLHLMQGVEPE
jgi:lambda repressor-like predicted transcriptional regulator